MREKDRPLGETRRNILRRMSVVGIPALTVKPFSGKNSTPYLNQTEGEELLPADKAVAEPVRTETGPETPSDNASVSRDTITADRTGRLSLDIGVQLDGSGQFGVSGSSYLVTAWTAPSNGLFRVEADYTVDSLVQQEPFSEDTTQLATTLVTNSGIGDAAQTVVSDQSRREWSLRNRKYSEEVLESLLEFLVSRLISSLVGPLGKRIAKFILDVVFDALIESNRDLKLEETWRTQVSSDFKAKKGQSYGLRFSSVGGITGQSESNSGGFHARISANYHLHRLTIKPISVSEHKLTIKGSEGIGNSYRFTVSGSLRSGSKADDTPTEYVKTKEGKRYAEGTVNLNDKDTYYYTGEITDWNHQGSMKIFIDGERWSPYGSGQEHELVIKGSEGIGNSYRFMVSDSLRAGSDVEDTPTEYVKTKEGKRYAEGTVNLNDEDTFYYTGEITDWNHQGSMKIFIDGERWFPNV